MTTSESLKFKLAIFLFWPKQKFCVWEIYSSVASEWEAKFYCLKKQFKK